MERTKQIQAVTDCDGLIDTFIMSQDVMESSRRSYRRSIFLFLGWVRESGMSLGELDRTDILRYKDSLVNKGLSPLTVGNYLVTVRRFYEWLESESAYPNIAKGVKTPHRVQAFKKQHLPESKIRDLIEYGKSLPLRDYAIINLILRTGLRTIEVVRANIEDITYKGDRRILRVWGKGRSDKDDFVVLTDKAFIPIYEYLSERGYARQSDPLFISRSNNNLGGRLSTRVISKICKDALRAVGLNGREYTAHSLRHTAAVSIIKQGGGITDVQAVLRHTSPATSEIYVESVKEELRIQNAPEQLLDNAF